MPTDNQSTVEVKPEAKSGESAKVIRDFGDGRFTPTMKEAYRDSQRLLSFTEPQAYRFATALGSDLGRAKWQGSVSYGSTRKSDAMMTLKDLAKAKITETYAVSIARTIAKLNELNNLGVVRCETGEVSLTDAFNEWLSK